MKAPDLRDFPIYPESMGMGLRILSYFVLNLIVYSSRLTSLCPSDGTSCLNVGRVSSYVMLHDLTGNR